ncbi:MAG: L-threonylcarbamoyladenylate synthase [Ruminococcus sp.]|nr:L-threonylcarbamoyladenylate synthase [Ruminococcus sp.]
MFETKILGRDDKSVEYAAELLKRGEVVGIPTETVYGLGANAFDENAVRKIFEAKGRPADNPLIVHISELSQIEELVTEIPRLAISCAEKFWAGPLTMIMPKSPRIPMATSGGLDTVGIRMPSDETARKIISACGFPIAAPSANLSGSPSPTSAQHVFNDMNGRIPAIVDGGYCCVGVESTVISFEGRDGIRLLRPGFISVEDLKEVTENVLIDKGVLAMLDENAAVSSPGMKYKHYAPKAEITLIEGNSEQFRNFVKENGNDKTTLMIFEDSDSAGLDFSAVCYGKTSEEQAHKLFDVLRELDNMGAHQVYARCPAKNGVGLAVYNRLLRAAAFRVIKL